MFYRLSLYIDQFSQVPDVPNPYISSDCILEEMANPIKGQGTFSDDDIFSDVDDDFIVIGDPSRIERVSSIPRFLSTTRSITNNHFLSSFPHHYPPPSVLSLIPPHIPSFPPSKNPLLITSPHRTATKPPTTPQPPSRPSNPSPSPPKHPQNPPGKPPNPLPVPPRPKRPVSAT